MEEEEEEEEEAEGPWRSYQKAPRTGLILLGFETRPPVNPLRVSSTNSLDYACDTLQRSRRRRRRKNGSSFQRAGNFIRIWAGLKGSREKRGG